MKKYRLAFTEVRVIVYSVRVLSTLPFFLSAGLNCATLSLALTLLLLFYIVKFNRYSYPSAIKLVLTV